MKKGLILVLGFVLAPLWVVAQNLITGHITDVRTGEPLIGASVIVKSEKSKVNVNGKVVIPMIYDNVRPFHEGYAAVRLNKKWGFLKLDDDEIPKK